MDAVKEVEVEDLALPVGSRVLLVRIYRPGKVELPVPVTLFLGPCDHDGPARAQAAHGDEAAVVPEPGQTPEDLLAVAAAVLSWIVRDGERRLLDAARVKLVCDGSGDELLSGLARWSGGRC